MIRKQLINRREILSLTAAATMATCLPAYAAVELPIGLRTIPKIPRGPSDVRNAHATGQKCDQLPGGVSVDFGSNYAAYLTDRDKKEAEALKLTKKPNPSTRQQMLTVGIQVDKAFVPKLPTASASTILAYVNEHFVSVQAKVQRDGLRNLYLHHRLYLATATFGKIRQTESFTAAVGSSVNELRTLGLLLPSKSDPTPENLRTIVLLHKHEALDAGALAAGRERVEDQFEYIFVRGKSASLGSKLELHVFATTEERKKLHHVKSGVNPRRPEECSMVGSVYFTKYVNNLEPTEAVMKSQVIKSKADFTMKELDTFVKSKLQLQGDTIDNITEVLDAIIDGRCKPSGAATAKPAAATASK